jgi:hypothetical protein
METQCVSGLGRGEIARDFCCVALLGCDLVAFVRRNDPLYLGVNMAQVDGELCVYRPNRFVLGPRHLDAIDTGRVPAFADEVEGFSRAPLEQLRQAPDPFVDFPENRLVQAKTLLTHVHHGDGSAVGRSAVSIAVMAPIQRRGDIPRQT